MKTVAALVLASLAAAAAAQQPGDDRPSRRLQISVRFDDSFDASQRRVDQLVQTIDGGRATIATEQSRPVRRRQYIQTPAGVVSQEITVVQEATSGFEVSPRISGRMVTLEILSGNGKSTVSGALGEWFELGAVASPSGSRSVAVKVEALD